MEPFSIACPACHQTLRVRNPALIGKHARCPRCQELVRIQPHDGRQGEPSLADLAAEERGFAGSVPETLPPLRSRAPAASADPGEPRRRASQKPALLLAGGLLVTGGLVLTALLLFGGIGGAAAGGTIDRTYLPDSAAIIGELRLSALLGDEGLPALAANPILQQQLGAPLDAFESVRFGLSLPPDEPHRINAVFVVTMNEPAARQVVEQLARTTPAQQFEGTTYYQPTQGVLWVIDDYQFAFASDFFAFRAVVDRQGAPARLRTTLAGLDDAVSEDDSLVILADLSALPSSNLSVPAGDEPAAQAAARVLNAAREGAALLRVTTLAGERLQASISLHLPNAARAQQVEADLLDLLEEGRRAWQQTRARMEGELAAVPQMPGMPQLDTMLDAVDQALAGARVQRDGTVVTTSLVIHHGLMANVAVLTAFWLGDNLPGIGQVLATPRGATGQAPVARPTSPPQFAEPTTHDAAPSDPPQDAHDAAVEAREQSEPSHAPAASEPESPSSEDSEVSETAAQHGSSAQPDLLQRFGEARQAAPLEPGDTDVGAAATQATDGDQPSTDTDTAAPDDSGPDLDARLDLPIRQIRVADQATLGDVLRLLDEMRALHLAYDEELLRQHGAALDAPVTLDTQETTAREVLDRLLQQFALTYGVENDRVHIVPAATPHPALAPEQAENLEESAAPEDAS